MRKQIIPDPLHQNETLHPDWLDLEELADVEITSEDPSHPIEAALLPAMNQGWRAAEPGKQSIRLTFKQPQQIHRIHLSFLELSARRTQEYVLRWSQDNGVTFKEIVRQQWNFSPEGCTTESEDHSVELSGVTVIELSINPDISGQKVKASLEKMRLG